MDKDKYYNIIPHEIMAIGYKYEQHEDLYIFYTCKECFEDSYTFTIENCKCDDKYLVSFNHRDRMFNHTKVAFTLEEKEAINKFIERLKINKVDCNEK